MDEIRDALTLRQRNVIRETLLGSSGEGQGLTKAQKSLVKTFWTLDSCGKPRDVNVLRWQ